MDNSNFQVIIVGGGLAGLGSAIHLSLLGIKVLLIEKNPYPKHKVCGEYLSKEVVPYLESLGVDLSDVVNINHFKFTSENGRELAVDLDLGGVGISRYTLDQRLYKRAIELGVEVILAKATSIADEQEVVKVVINDGRVFTADFCIASYGKRSTLDRKMNRKFISSRTPWIGVKAHYSGIIDKELVSLHHFEGGYCGVSAVEDSRINVCYLIHQSVFDRYKDLELVNKKVLSKNPYLKEFLDSSEMIFEKPLTISQIFFGDRQKQEGNILYAGDSAGMIHPLAGNGMAMAIHSGAMASISIAKYFTNELSKSDVSSEYSEIWEKSFSPRIKSGRKIQKLLENSWLCNKLMNVVPMVPFILKPIVKSTHGKTLRKFGEFN